MTREDLIDDLDDDPDDDTLERRISMLSQMQGELDDKLDLMPPELRQKTEALLRDIYACMHVFDEEVDRLLDRCKSHFSAN